MTVNQSAAAAAAVLEAEIRNRGEAEESLGGDHRVPAGCLQSKFRLGFLDVRRMISPSLSLCTLLFILDLHLSPASCDLQSEESV